MKRLELITSEEYISTYLEQKIVSGHSVKTMRADVAKFVKDLVDEIVSPSPGEGEAVAINRKMFKILEYLYMNEYCGDHGEEVKIILEQAKAAPGKGDQKIMSGFDMAIWDQSPEPGKVSKEVGLYDEDQLALEIDHILESGVNLIRLLDLFKRFFKLSQAPAPPPAGEKMREALEKILDKCEDAGYVERIASEALSQPPGNDEWVKVEALKEIQEHVDMWSDEPERALRLIQKCITHYLPTPPNK